MPYLIKSFIYFYFLYKFITRILNLIEKNKHY